MSNNLIQTVSHISELSRPVDLHELALILSSFHALPENKTLSDINLLPHWQLLTTLTRKIEAWKELNEQLAMLSQNESATRVINEPATSLNPTRQKRKLIKAARARAISLYRSVYEWYETDFYQNNPLSAIYNPDDNKGKLGLLKEYKETLAEQLLAATKANVTLMLFEQRQKINLLTQQLEELGVRVVDSTEASQTDMMTHLHERSKSLATLLSTLNELLTQLTETLTVHPAGPISSSLNPEIEETQARLSTITVQLAKLPLAAETKAQLIEAYDKSANKELLITQMEGDIRWRESWINAKSWIDWYRDPQFSDKWTEQQKALGYLRLLHHRSELVASLQLFSNQPIVQQKPPTDDLVLLKIKQALMHAELNRAVEHCSPEELFKELINSIACVQNQIDRLNTTTALLSERHMLEQQIQSLQTRHLHLEELPSLEIIRQLQADSESRNQLITKLQAQSNQCDAAIDALAQLHTLTNELKALKKNKEKPKAQEIPSFRKQHMLLEQQIRELQADIDNDLSLLDKPPFYQLEEPVLSNGFDENEMIEADPLVTLIYWNQKIQPKLRNQTLEFFNWYQRLYQALSNNLPMEQNNLLMQMDQVLHDIDFELNNPVPPGAYNVLQAWQSLCYQPNMQWRNLTEIKPPVSPEIHELPAVNCYPVRKRLAQLYQQCQRLNRKYPREALLLEQATLNLHKMALLKQEYPQHPALENMPSILTDPRYDCLQRHRGFKKVWEWLAELFTSIRGLFSYQPPLSYRNRFVYTPTETVKLIRRTETALADMPVV